MRTRELLAVLLLIGLGATAHAAPITILDNFNDNSVNTSLWLPLIVMGSGTSSEVNQRLEMSAIGSSPGGSAAVMALLGTIAGDFDVRVRYALPDGPFDPSIETGAGIVLTTPTYPVGFTVARDTVDDPSTCLPGTAPCNGYVGAFPYPAHTPNEFKVRTTDLSGELRFTRVGDVMSAEYRYVATDPWVVLHQADVFGSEPITGLYLGVFTFGAGNVNVRFDDFWLQADDFMPIPEPASLLLLGTGLIGFARWRKRKH